MPICFDTSTPITTQLLLSEAMWCLQADGTAQHSIAKSRKALLVTHVLMCNRMVVLFLCWFDFNNPGLFLVLNTH